MREETHTIKIYKYSELSDKAKDYAHQKFVERDYRDLYYWVDESIESLKAFLAWVGLKITNYSICPYTPSFIHTDIPEDYQKEIRVKSVEYRLLGLDIPEIEDRLEEDFDPAAILIEQAEFNFPATCKTVGAHNQGWGTGYCMDDSIIHYWNEHLREHPMDNIGALHAVVDGVLKDIVADMEYQDSKEYFEAVEEDYDNEYLEDGTLH